MPRGDAERRTFGTNLGSNLLLHLVSWVAGQVIEFVRQSFQGGVLREKRGSKMRFEFSQQANQCLGDLFGFLEVRGGLA